MKKILTLLMVMALIMTGFTACGSGNEGEAGGNAAGSVEGTPAEIIEKIYEQYPVADLPLGTIEIDLADADAVKMFTGLDSADKIDSAADAASVAEEMMNGIDQRKWICVEADDLRVAAAGDVVVLMMVSSQHADVVTAEGIIGGFEAVAGALDLNETK